MFTRYVFAVCAPCLVSAVASPPVDPSTLNGKFMLGYQGWFATPCDGMDLGWSHWSRSRKTPGPDPNHEGYLNFDNWPDLTEFADDELCPTDLHFADGSVAGLYSAANAATVRRHFEWLADNSVDGVFKQRFPHGFTNPKILAFNDRVTLNVRAGAEATGRVWAMMYDISGMKDGDVVDVLSKDWKHLVHDLNITSSSSYLHHRGKPLVSVWGLGFSSRDPSSQSALAVQAFFKSEGVSLMGGVPTGWRELTGDSKTDTAWAEVYRAFDVISPWNVGRFCTDAQVTEHMNKHIVPDMAEAAAAGSDYLPVVFPGGSAFYEPRDPPQPFNRCPRRGGRFFWKQLVDFVGTAKAPMLYGAMLDEVNEGTAFFKIAARKEDTPTNAEFLYNDIDGDDLPADWWLQLAGHASRVLSGAEALTPDLPAPPSTLVSGGRLEAGGYLMSSDGSVILQMQGGDGNLVMRRNRTIIWASHTQGNPGAQLYLHRSDGNLVVYDSKTKQTLWSSHAHQGAAKAVLRNDCSFAVYDDVENVLWDLGTTCSTSLATLV